MRKSINWASRIAKEAAADVKSNLRTKISERKHYTRVVRDVSHVVEVCSDKQTLGDGNSITGNHHTERYEYNEEYG